jgi:hypothetical protein
MAVKIEKKIVGYEVAKADDDKQAKTTAVAPKETLLQRSEVLGGQTYKVKPPTGDHALYITINDIVDDHGKVVPFEIFINSKNMEQFQWIVALTRLISAVFRKGGDVTFLIEELKSVFDPRGGYFLKGKYYPSVVAEIGAVIERHMQSIGLIDTRLDDAQAQLIAEKRAEFEARHGTTTTAGETEASYPPHAVICGKCSEKAVVKLDGCMVCLHCADSKCG